MRLWHSIFLLCMLVACNPEGRQQPETDGRTVEESSETPTPSVTRSDDEVAVVYPTSDPNYTDDGPPVPEMQIPPDFFFDMGLLANSGYSFSLVDADGKEFRLGEQRLLSDGEGLSVPTRLVSHGEFTLIAVDLATGEKFSRSLIGVSGVGTEFKYDGTEFDIEKMNRAVVSEAEVLQNGAYRPVRIVDPQFLDQ